jgi:hypothetical protein
MDTNINVRSSFCEVSVILFRKTCLDRLSKNTPISTSIKILSLGAELLYANRQTDMTKLIVAFFEILRTRLNSSVTHGRVL